MKKIWLLLLWGCALCVQAKDFERCEDLMVSAGLRKGHMFAAQELQLLEKEMRKLPGDVWPVVWSLMHFCGLGVVKDEAKGEKILQSSGEGGNAIATLLLAGIYSGGLGAPPNMPKAVEWLRSNSIAGMAEAQFALGELYARGRLIPRNSGEAERWFLKAAAQGNADAQEALGHMYFFDKRDREAFPWLQMAAFQGKSEARVNFKMLTQAVEDGYVSLQTKENRPVPAETPPLLKIADTKQERSLRASVLDGKPESKLALAAFLEMTEWDQPRLIASLSAAKEGTSEYKAASERVDRQMRERNREAVEWINRAVQQGDSAAIYKLGTANWYGALGLSDEREGLRLIRSAAALSHADAIFWLARAHQQGTGVPKNLVVAYALYFYYEKIQSRGELQLADFVPPLEVSLNESRLREAQQLAQSLVVTGQFLSVLDNAVAGAGR